MTSKTRIPHVHSHVIKRDQLGERLRAAAQSGIVLICAPAGFGKTTLAAAWAASASLPVAWLSLDPEDNDPARFWRCVAATLNRVSHDADAPLAQSDDAADISPTAAPAALAHGLASRPEAVLVLDDFHVIDSGSIRQGMAFLLDHRPPQLHVVIVSRTEPGFPLGRLRAAGRLVELRADDLRFTREEAESFMLGAWQLDLPPRAVETLRDRTEGWPAGLQLAALSLRGHSDAGRFIEEFTGSHRHVMDYLSEEVLDRQPEDVRDFLLRTSVLDRLSGSLCDAVTGQSGGIDILRRLDRSGLFLVPLDEHQAWYRYHHLFLEFLRSRAERLGQELLSELHRRAADWFQANQLVGGAIQHAIAAGQADWAALLLEEHAEERFWGGEGGTVRRWLRMLPGCVVSARPSLCLATAMTALISGRPGDVGPWLDQAERAAAVIPSGPRACTRTSLHNVAGMTALLRADAAKQAGDADPAERWASEALRLASPRDYYLRLLGEWNVTLAHLMQGRVDQVVMDLTRHIAEWQARGHAYFAVRGCYALSVALRAQGRLSDALDACWRGLTIAVESGGELTPVAGVARIGLAQLLRERNELDEALRQASLAVERCRQLGHFQWTITSLATLAWVQQARGDLDAATSALDEIEHSGPRPLPETSVDFLNPAPVLRGRMLIGRGNVSEAENLLLVRGVRPEDPPSYLREPEQLLLARILLARGDHREALALLGRLHVLASAQGRTGSIIEMLVLEAVAYHGAGEEDRALSAMARALSAGRPEGYIRVFADEGAVAAGLLRRMTTAGGTDVSSLALVLRACEARGPGDDPAGLAEPLTPRELQVLRLLADGQRNREIAEQLVITLETAKTHVAHIAEKLGASNRTESVARARALGLLP